jgi:hypothetical protein
VRGVARSDSDYYAAAVLARLAQHRWQATMPELAKQPVFVRSDAYVLPGAFRHGRSSQHAECSGHDCQREKSARILAGTPATAAELERAKTELVNETAVMTSKSDALPDPWLDADTYRLSAVQDQLSLLRGVSAADIQRVASRLFKDPAIASVLAGDSAQLKPSLQGRFQFEVLGEIASPAPSPKPPTKPASSVSPR